MKRDVVKSHSMEELFVKKECRLCDTRERHTADLSDGRVTARNDYWLDESNKFIGGNAYAGDLFARFSVPVRFCPFCGKEL